MSDTELIKKLEKRITDLENKSDKNDKSDKSDKKPKIPRKPSEYNTFMGDYMSKNKSDKKPHKELFADAVKAWNLKKK